MVNAECNTARRHVGVELVHTVGEPDLVAIAALKPADSPRLGGENLEHIRMLAEVDAPIPPITVHRQTMRVIDGMHRLRAAISRGEREIAVRYFDGDDRDAFVLAVRANISHGLPLSFADRAAAAERIILSHPNWSDRAIARTAGISAKSVSGVRAKVLGASAQLASRIGADGRERPPNSSPDGRLRVAQLLKEHPSASLRDIAREADVSISTVTDVRKRIERGDDPVLPSQRRAETRTARERTAERPRGESDLPVRDEPPVRAGQDILQVLQRDPSLRFSEQGRHLLRILHATVAGAERLPELASTVPDHQADLVAKLAEDCASQWRALAEDIRLRIDGTVGD